MPFPLLLILVYFVLDTVRNATEYNSRAIELIRLISIFPLFQLSEIFNINYGNITERTLRFEFSGFPFVCQNIFVCLKLSRPRLVMALSIDITETDLR